MGEEVAKRKATPSLPGKRRPEDYANTALWCLPSSHPLRAVCIKMAHSKPFEWTVLLLILANCVFLAMTEPFGPCCVDDVADATCGVADHENERPECGHK